MLESVCVVLLYLLMPSARIGAMTNDLSARGEEGVLFTRERSDRGGTAVF